MPSATPHGRMPERSLSWPPTINISTDISAASYKGEPGSVSASSQYKPSYDPFTEDLDANPEDYFLSPIQMYEYDDWAEDSDDDGEEVEWDAGITDFALFDDDRRRAQETNEPLPSRWQGMLDQQASALQRAVERNRADMNAEPAGFLSAEDLPSLTPDTSPNLRDDLDVDSYHGQTAERPSVPAYLTITITSPDEDDDTTVENRPLSFFTGRKQLRSQTDRKLQRPGLRHSRTMSGQIHAWRRPSRDMYTVGEDADAEEQAEMCMIRRVSSSGNDDDDEDRGRPR